MDIRSHIAAIAAFLSPLIPYLLKADMEKAAKPGTKQKGAATIEEDYAPDVTTMEKARSLWDLIRPKLATNSSLKDAVNGLNLFPYDEDATSTLRFQLKIMTTQDEKLAIALSKAWGEVAQRGVSVNTSTELNTVRWADVLNREDDVIKRLEMIRLLRIGMDPIQIAQMFHTDIDYLYRVHSAFTLAGVNGIVSGSNIRHWLDNLNYNDPLLRRLEIIRLLRAGSPPEVIAREYNTTKEYIYRLNDRFTNNGYLGVLTEDDMIRYRQVNPPIIRICSFNLHGTHDSDAARFRRVANELSVFDPEVCAYQEVISGAGIEETSAQIARWMTNMTGNYYRTHYSYCHLYMERYPEGVAVSSRYELKNKQTINLNANLMGGLRPAMERYAAACEVEIYGRRVIFVSLHLDHHENSDIRLAQAQKLLEEINRLYGDESSYYCVALAGDFNDVENSPVISFLKDEGFIDTYRSIHPTGGNTFNTVDPFTRIDYIMVKGNIQKVHWAELILNNPQFSDHIGLYTVIE